MEAKDLIRKYLGNNHVMQLATMLAGKPQICTVHYAFDDDFNLYWCSSRTSHHSMALKDNKQVAVGILQDVDLRQCIHAQGKAYQILDEKEAQKADEFYSQRFGKSPKRLQSVLAEGEEAPGIYVFKPSQLVLFDAANFPDNPRNELKLS
ncbi:pyridoxamine 5'-phosphate oxidase family protein [Candidatus Saccharibacteria bacterium]|nr:pyridoxamine 5'-phosphate oxidase family protein [Candidatus Saccharibacteria bacterium]